jgi:diguanylate cyclase (GGDEF)-like protein
MRNPPARSDNPVPSEEEDGPRLAGEVMVVLVGAAALAAVVLSALMAGGVWTTVRVDYLVGLAMLVVVLVAVSLRLLVQRRSQLRHLASTDVLTGGGNRRAFQRELERHFHPGAGLMLMLLDLDDLKALNDSLGFAVGDAVLAATAQRVQACLRSSDMVARLDSDEFAVLLPRVDPDYLETLCHRILEAVQRPHPAALHNCTMSASAGVVLQDAQASIEELLRDAGVALTEAKRSGKGRWVRYRPDIHAGQLERIAFEHDLRTALDQGQFVLHYQPMVESKTGRIIGVEALVRWNHPDRGLVPPLEFVPVAEATGLIVPLGAWVLREACRTARRWQLGTPGLLADFVISVNISARQLFGTQLEEDVAAALGESGLDPRHLVLEIVESQVMTDLAAALRQIAALRARGVRIAIDDFGTGYSSLGHLRELPVDFLKLDKSFTEHIADSPRSQELMRTVAELSHNLAITTVAEGVETLAQAVVLHAMDVNLCQGYYFARPVDGPNLALLLQRVSHLPEDPPHPESAGAAGARISVRLPSPALTATPPN